MKNEVKLIECPRDAWQGLPKEIPAEVKADYLRLLLNTGFRHIDAVSFVSPAAVPQMADSEQVMALLAASYETMPEDAEIIGIVVNAKGAQRAIATGSVSTLGFPYSISPTFLERNQRQTPEESLDALDAIGQAAYKAGLSMVAYVSMAFGNPYGDPWGEDEVAAACELLEDNGIEQISLADTVGLATPEVIERVFRSALEGAAGAEIGMHLHARADEVADKIAAGYHAGCRRFDTAIGGLGGCPFAQDAFVGNVATELAIAELERLGASLPPPLIKPGALDLLQRLSGGIAEKYGVPRQ